MVMVRWCWFAPTIDHALHEFHFRGAHTTLVGDVEFSVGTWYERVGEDSVGSRCVSSVHKSVLLGFNSVLRFLLVEYRIRRLEFIT